MAQPKPRYTETPALKVVQAAQNIIPLEGTPQDKEAIRQAMYARIAHGQAVEEVEQQARCKWSGGR